MYCDCGKINLNDAFMQKFPDADTYWCGKNYHVKGVMRLV